MAETRRVEYSAAAVDVEAGPQEKMVVLVKKRSSSGWMWKACGVTVVLLLCVGAIFFMWNLRRGSEMMNQFSHSRVDQGEAEKTDLQYTLSQIGSKAPAAIHLEGSQDGDGQDPDEQLQWNDDQGQAFTLGGFTLKNNRIVIPQTGLYFVYSQASYRVSCNSEDGAGKGLIPLSHRIWRFSDSMGSKATLMSGVRSACQSLAQNDSVSNDNTWYNTIYLGAVFQLNKEDELWTETNQLSELDTDEGKTFFGVFAL